MIQAPATIMPALMTNTGTSPAAEAMKPNTGGAPALALYERARALEWRDPRVHTNLAIVRQQLGTAPVTASAMVPGHAAASASGYVVPTRSAQTLRSETTRDGAPEAATMGLTPLERLAALENGLHGESTRDGAPDSAAPL